jgi:hypothetical protein
MGTRRALASVADGTVGAFVARSNDVGHFWALGVLLEDAPPGDPDLVIDLMTGRMTPALLGSRAAPLGDAWARYLRWSLSKHEVKLDVVRSARLTVDFDRTEEIESWIPGGRDNPFVCTVTIEDDRGHRYAKSREGHCAPPSQFQDPNPYRRPRPSGGPGDAGRMEWRLTSQRS